MDVPLKESGLFKIWMLLSDNSLKTETSWPSLKKPEEEKPSHLKLPPKFTNNPPELLMKPS